MYEVTVNEDFCAAHFLHGYKGKCENMHGHNYRIEFTLAGTDLDTNGLLYDFVDIRSALKSVLEDWDHTVLNQIEPFGRMNPTAENIAREICRLMGKKIDLSGIEWMKCVVWETERSRASYTIGTDR